MIYFIGNSSAVQSSLYEQSTVEECLEYFKEKEYIAIDTETKGRDPHTKKIICLQIGDADNQFVIDCRCINILRFKELLESKICLGHNIKFDYKFLKHVGIELDRVYDTMLAECILFCGYDSFGYSLKDVAQRYLQVDLDKTTRGDFFKLESQPFTDKQIEYAALDVTYLHRIRELQHINLQRYDLLLCAELEMETLKSLGDIEYNGMGFNKELWLKNSENSEEQLMLLEKKIDSLIIKDSVLSKIYKPEYVQGNLFGYEQRELSINYASPLQISKIFKELGVYVDSTDDRELSKLVRRDLDNNVISSKHKFFELLQDYRELGKVVSTYGRSFINYVNKSTQRVHTDFWQIKQTGRISSGSKDMNAPNVQNIPADNKFRNCFVAREGFTWISSDFTGQELAIMADLSGEKVFIDAINKKEDLHSISATLLFGKLVTKKDKVERTAAKTLTFGLAYGMGPNKLSDKLGITIDEAKELMSKFEKAFPTVSNWLIQAGKKGKIDMRSTTQDICKRIRWYPEMRIAKDLRSTVVEGDKETWRKIMMIEGSTEREAKNHLIQGCGANLTKDALVQVRNLVKSYNLKYSSQVAYLICTVHDQIDVEVRDDLAEEFAKEMTEIMINCSKKYVKKVIIDVDTTRTKKWNK